MSDALSVVKPGLKEVRHIRQLQSYVSEVRSLVQHSGGCDSEYHGERYCLAYRTGEYSRKRAGALQMVKSFYIRQHSLHF